MNASAAIRTACKSCANDDLQHELIDLSCKGVRLALLCVEFLRSVVILPVGARSPQQELNRPIMIQFSEGGSAFLAPRMHLVDVDSSPAIAVAVFATGSSSRLVHPRAAAAFVSGWQIFAQREGQAPGTRSSNKACVHWRWNFCDQQVSTSHAVTVLAGAAGM